MTKENAKSKSKGEDKTLPIHEKGEDGSKEGAQVVSDIVAPSEKEDLLALYQKLKDLGINSISDLEVKISRLA